MVIIVTTMPIKGETYNLPLCDYLLQSKVCMPEFHLILQCASTLGAPTKFPSLSMSSHLHSKEIALLMPSVDTCNCNS